MVRIRQFAWFSAVLLLGMLPATAQQNPNIAEATHPLGFSLKKVVSNTTICAGQTFSYTIYYSFPAGTQQVTITDAIPQPLLVQSVSVNNTCGTPTVTAPPPGTNGTVTVQWSSGIPAGGCSGSMTIVVSFPNGTTCNGTAARNRVCLAGIVKTPQGNQVADFCTPFVSTTAQATNPWQIQKQILGAAWAGGSCSWKYAGDTVTYQIQVCKNNPAPCGGFGQLNLVNGIVTDVLPTGAQFIGASCSNVSYNAGTNTITWNVGNLSATQPYNCASCNITVYYPPSTFPTNTQITNTATLSGQLGSANNPCGQFTQNTSVCWTKVLPPPPTTTATLWKWVNTNAQPGCSGYYYIQLCNTGNTTISSATITDTIPTSLTITSTTPTSGGLNITTTGNIVSATLSSSLSPGQCRWFYIYFTISPTATPNSTITNCAWAQVPGLAPMQSCASFVVNAPAPSACIQKEICSPQASYSPGQVVRVRFRLQNIGGQGISGATLTDNLDPNFQYVGNPAFYTSSSWTTPCNPQSGTSAWSPTPSLSVSGQTITVSNITIPATCQSLFWNGCGFYGNTGVPYYWIEFDVKIRDTAALGNIPNFYTLSGGGLPQPVQSNTVLVLVTGNVGFTLNKTVAPDTTNWQSSLTASAGSTVNYRLQMNLTGTVGLRHVTFVDLLPMDNGTSDGKILQACGTRGSQYDVTYQSLLLSSPVGASVYNNPATTLANANATSAATGAPANLFPNACGTAGTWSSGASAGNKNVAFYFGSGGIGVSTPPQVVFAGKLSPNAQPGQIACNTFAAGGAVRHYLNSTTAQDVPIGPLESGTACVTIDSSSRCYSVQLHGAPVPVGIVSTPKGNACKYNVALTVINPGAPTQGCAYSNEGQVSPNSFSIPSGTSSLTLTFVDIPPQNTVACIVFGVPDAPGVCQPCDTVCFDLRPCPQQDTCCPRFERVSIKCIGRDTAGNMTYAIVATGSIPCKATLIIGSPEGSFTPSAFSVGPGAFTISTTFTDLPPTAPGVMTVYYTVIGQGVVLCRDSARVQLPPCPQQPRNCCEGWSRNIQSTVKWFSNGAIQIAGTATAGPAPIHRFAAAIVSAQLKRWCPIVPPPPSPWQRIYGDVTGGWLIPAPGAPQMLTPFSRQLLWEGPIPDSCISWAQQPATFQLNMLFPAPSGFKCGDSLRFTMRYTFTDCECRTCDTLITYTVVRKKTISFPWDAIAVKRVAPNTIDIIIPGTRAISDDSTMAARLRVIELYGGRPTDVQVYRCTEKDDNCDQPAEDVGIKITEQGCIVLFPEGANSGYLLRKIDDKLVVLQSEKAHVIWEETDLRSGESQTVSEERELSIPPYSQQPTPTGTLVQDRESMPPHVRTFALAFVNGEQPAEGIEVELMAMPQPDGTVPTIIAIGPVDGNGLVIKCPSKHCGYFIEQPLSPGEVFRPLYITVAGAKRDALDAVEVEYTLRDRRGTVIARGRVLLEGAVSGIDGSDGEEAVVHRGIIIGSIIPNPASESVTVALQSHAAVSGVTIALYDGLGRHVSTLVHNGTLPNGTTALPVDVSQLPAGVYTLLVGSPHGSDAKRLVVTR